MNTEQIRKISLAFEISEKDLKQCLKKIAPPRSTKKTNSIINEIIEETINTPNNENVYYFLEEDYIKLNEKINKISEEISRLGQEIAHSVDVSGETFHDNFVYDEGMRQQSMWSDEKLKLETIKSKARVIEKKQNNDNEEKFVTIGSVLVLSVNSKTTHTEIGSYLNFHKGSISYASEFAKNIINMKKGEQKEFIINHKKMIVVITEIN